MREFKIAHGFVTDVSAFSAAGKSLNSDYAAVDSSGVSTLATSMAYISQHEQIKSLVDSYIALVEKDVKDLIAMQQEASRMDASLSGWLGKS